MQRALAAFLVVVLASCSALAPKPVPPRVSVAAVEVKSLAMLEQHFDVALRVANPNAFELTVEALEFDLEVNGRAFASGGSRVPTPLPAGAETVLRIDAVTRSGDLIVQLRTLSPQLLKRGLPYRIAGRVKTDKSSRWLPFEHLGVYRGRTSSGDGAGAI